MGGALFEGMLQGAWALILCAPVLVASVGATVFVVQRRALAGNDSQAERSDQLFWDLFLGAAVAVPALLIPTLLSPWTGLFLGGAGVATGIAAYRGTPKYLAKRSAKRENHALETAHLAAQAQHDELIARWRRYELDPACNIDFPALTDVRTPETSALIKAMRHAEALRSAAHQGYPDAVSSLGASLAAAERAAGLPAEQA
ncbi:hypothetical protein [Pseudarthrobacter sp. NamE5]|uniref:hypothetical protein n=1 Tax=Pseudarthrobacter sp. NamE5 TaxID=2576839 RepID=UPI00110BBEF8|nr:hypothetical protein [Pseudarthrobacter sp. NamE5]TLM82595.1 hypothetical protein FDW84_15815 [Pseudarthrobacter sp. NamE5]